MSADPLSDVLQAVRLRGAVFYWVEAAPPWAAVSPPAREIAAKVMPGADHVMEFHLLVEGACWAGLLGAAPERAEAGDVVVFPQGDAHCFRSALDLPPPPPGFPPGERPSLPIVMRHGTGTVAAARFVCGYLGCDARPFNPLLAALPRMLRVPSGEGPLRELMRLAVAETATPRPGGEALRARLAEMMFVEAVRLHLARVPREAVGWLAALREPQVAGALALLHGWPAQRWTLEVLAREVGLSRTLLHERFTRFVGLPPMQYLARWRVQLAATRMAQGGDKVAAIALEVGYESEAAFNRAFKRLVGVPPAAWRRSRGAAS
ncbi:MAG TPA: AraC family transcriptional regulator [Crenalkalicoccus sp.]|nr:AraC family transcriptional regulator [Crenalkalicoccus sp.]